MHISQMLHKIQLFITLFPTLTRKICHFAKRQSAATTKPTKQLNANIPVAPIDTKPNRTEDQKQDHQKSGKIPLLPHSLNPQDTKERKNTKLNKTTNAKSKLLVLCASNHASVTCVCLITYWCKWGMECASQGTCPDRLPSSSVSLSVPLGRPLHTKLCTCTTPISLTLMCV